MRLIINFTVLIVTINLVRTEFPLEDNIKILKNELGDEIYRLPENLDPVHYDVEITPFFEAEGDKEAFTFDGIVTIEVTALEDNITDLIIHENVISIVGVTVTDASESIINLASVERQRDYHFLKISLVDGTTLQRGQRYKIRVVYVGRMNETPLSRGVFRGSYVGDDGRRHWYAATHLQPTNSRQAFPSFDEPGFKSTFTIIINRPAHFTETFSNMKIAQNITNGDRVKEIFHPTPEMSAYLVTFHISEEFRPIADNNDSSKSYRVLARPNAVGQGNYALAVGPPVTEWLETYLGVPYYTMGEDMKNDQIASPDWASGATENWGLVSYRELRLLFDENESSSADRLNIATIIAHELAHKWFGNLVTCRWWDNVWINEGYASYFEYFAMDGVDPAMELADQFNIMYVQSALSTDSSASTRALQHTVNTPAQVTSHFTDISYSKGAALLNMLKHFLSEETFRKALNLYLVEMAYEHAFPADVYRNFQRAVEQDGSLNAVPNLNITDFIAYWVNEPGYPVLNVDVDMSTGVLSLKQERFYINSQAQSSQVWPLPLTYTAGNSPNWEQTKATHVMTTETYEITKDPGHEWVIFNVKQNGLYRVNYDTHNWEMIAAALNNDLTSIHYLNRAQIVDDVFALMRSGRMRYQLGFQVLDFLKRDTSYYSWYPAITGFNWLRNRFSHMPDTLAQYDEVLFEFLDAVVSDLTFDPSPSDSLTRNLNRFYTLSFACNIGHPGCVNDAIEKYSNMMNNGVSVHPDLRRHVFCAGLRNGGYNEWRFLYNRFLDSNHQGDEIVMLRALGCSSDETAVREYLELILSDKVRAQDRVNAFSYLFIGDPGNARRALPFVKEHTDEIRDAVVGASRSASVFSSMASYMDEEGLVEFEEWLNQNPSLPEYSVGINAINAVRNNWQWGSERAEEILSAARGSAFYILSSMVLVLASLFVHLLQ